MLYSNINIRDITIKDYERLERISENFGIIHLGKYHDFYVQSDTLSLADSFESFQGRCIEIY